MRKRSNHICPAVKGFGGRLSQYHDAFDVVSFGHALFVLVAGATCLLFELPHWRFWQWGSWFVGPTSAAQRVIFGTSALYYCFDILVVLLTHAHYHRKEVAMLLHHVVCITGLIGPVLTGQDGTIILFGMLVGECSNPPRALYSIWARLGGTGNSKHSLFRFSCEDPSKRVKTAESLRLFYFVLFAMSRIFAAHYVAHVVLPFASLIMTKLAGIFLVIFSAICIWDYAITSRSSSLLV